MNKEQRREWRLYILGCADLTHAERVVLLALETFADYPQGTNARPGRERLAEMCGLSTRTVTDALAKARGLQLIQQTVRANPKAKRAAVYQLLALSTRSTVRVESTSSTRSTVRVEAVTGDDFNEKPKGFKVKQTGFQGEANPVSTRSTLLSTNPSPIQKHQFINTYGSRALARALSDPQKKQPPNRQISDLFSGLFRSVPDEAIDAEVIDDEPPF